MVPPLTPSEKGHTFIRQYNTFAFMSVHFHRSKGVVIYVKISFFAEGLGTALFGFKKGGSQQFLPLILTKMKEFCNICADFA